MPFITLSDCLTKSRPTVEVDSSQLHTCPHPITHTIVSLTTQDVSLLWMCAAQRRHYNKPKRLSFFSKVQWWMAEGLGCSLGAHNMTYLHC